MRWFLLSALLLAPALALGGEAEWKARHDEGDAARLEMKTAKSEAIFAALAKDIEASLKAAIAKDPQSEGVATDAYWLAYVYLRLNRYREAAPLLLRSLDLRSKRFGEDSDQAAEVLEKVIWVADQSKVDALWARILQIRERVHGADSRAVADTLRDIAMNRLTSSRYDEAEKLYDRSVAIMEKKAGRDGPDVVPAISSLAWLYVVQDRNEEAIPLYQRALAITEKAGGSDDRLAEALENLAYAYQGTKRYTEAEELYLRALPLREKAHGPNDITTQVNVGRLHDIYDITNQWSKKREMTRRIEAARE